MRFRESDSPGGAIERSELYWLRDTLGTVAPRDPRTRRLGPRRYRLDLLAECLDRDNDDAGFPDLPEAVMFPKAGVTQTRQDQSHR